MLAARHQQPPALLADEEIERLHEVRGNLMGGDVVQNHGARAGNKSRFQLRRIGDDFDSKIQRFERFRRRVILIASGQHDARAAGDFDPTRCTVVAEMCVVFRTDFCLILEAAAARDAVGELDDGHAVRESDR